jgi:diguanylate cyclase (GGDEF)-like protein
MFRPPGFAMLASSMLAPPLPPNETARLAALARLQIMDTGPDPRFDSFVRLAADMYGVQIALVSLLDQDRQWFKAARGLETKQTSRKNAFCAYAILNPSEVLVVEDATRDPRFADNPLVLGDPNIRFYAGAVVHAPSGHPMGTLCLIDRAPRTMDAAERRRLQDLAGGVSALLALHGHAADMQHAATRDALTGLANRAMFDVALDRAVADALDSRPCALLLLDLDRFKAVNDTLGHAAGDTLLREVAGRLTQAVRDGDLCARFGGDEFAVLMTNQADAAAANSIASRIAEAFAEPVMLDGTPTTPQASIGIALCPLDATSPGALFRAADQALYQVKRAKAGAMARGAVAGRSATAALAGPNMDEDLREALRSDALKLHYQPVLEAATGAIAGYEALQRWNRPGHGPVSPGIYIPYAEAHGLIGGMDVWTLHEACRAAALWARPLSVAVNMSAHWFGGPEIVGLVSEALDRSGLAPGRLCLEITERTVIANRDIAGRQIASLHDLGVQMALDDFGTGYSSMSYLRDLPFDQVKLDNSFVAAIGNARADSVAGAIIDLGHRLDMKVCAEGVETEAQLAFLRVQGCDLVQGFLLGRPGAEIAP